MIQYGSQVYRWQFAVLGLVCALMNSCYLQDALAQRSFPAPQLRPVPAHLSVEAKSVLRHTQQDVFNKFIQNAAESYQKAVPGFETTPVTLGGVKAYWATTPKTQRDDAVVVYVHGGGYFHGDGKADAGVFLPVYEELGIKGLSVDYRLAPKHPFPAAVQDCVSLYLALLEQGYKPENVALTGDSVGGALVLSTVISLRDAGKPLPAALVLVSPGTLDMTYAGDTRITLLDWDTWLPDDKQKVLSQYVRDANPKDPLVSPIFADYRGFPPMLIQVGTREWLLSDSLRLARKAREAKVEVTLDVWDGMWHAFHIMWPHVPESRKACTAIATFLQPRILGGNKDR